jgi:hypothetical protein
VRGIWRGLGIDQVSFTDVLLTAEDPLSLYSGIHFTREGYEVTARYMISHLDRLRRAAGQSGMRPSGASEKRPRAPGNPLALARPARSRARAHFESLCRRRGPFRHSIREGLLRPACDAVGRGTSR